MKRLNEVEVSNLNMFELIHINGGTDNCPAKSGQSLAYYVGYAIGWFFD